MPGPTQPAEVGDRMSDGPVSGSLPERVRLFFEHNLPAHPEFEPRPEQLTMALAVATAIEDQELLVAEAGTGTGKSLAYLVPALLWSLEHGKPVVISTRTLNLQQQLLDKDLPLLRRLAQSETPWKAAAARGWGNYVCLRRLETACSRLAEGAGAPAEGTALGALALARELNGGAPGVRQMLRVSDEVWSEVRADSAACNRQACPHYADCYFFRARKELEGAQLIIANHSLVLSDLALRRQGAGGILPEPGCWVLDEGHHLEDVANDHLGVSVNARDLARLRQNVYDPKGRADQAGWLPALRGRVAYLQLPDETRRELLGCVDHGLVAALPSFYSAGEEFFVLLAAALALASPREPQARLTLSADFFHTAEGEACRNAAAAWVSAAEGLEGTALQLLEQFNRHEAETQAGGVSELQALLERLRGLRRDLEFCLFPEDPDWVFWGQATAHDTELGATPLDVGDTLAREFFGPARSVVLTSATLAVGDDLSFFEGRVGLDQHQARLTRLCLASPFDYARQAYLGVATDLSDANDSRFWDHSGEALAWLVQRLGGRTFLLGTSMASLRSARRSLEPWLEGSGIRLLVQGEAPPSALLESFRRDPRALLLGADSFWEGVDVPGADLVCVILTRLPFRVPSDPVVRAHCQRLESEGQSAFNDYQVPQAVLRFRQGFGRLIRSSRDRGMVLVLDSRLYHKSYGKRFLSGLPPCRRRAGTLSGVVQDAVRWLHEGQKDTAGLEGNVSE